MDEIKRSQGGSVLNTTQTTSGSGAPTVKRVVREIQSLLRSVAAAGDIIDAADTLAPTHPELAEFLRVYGAGRTSVKGRTIEGELVAKSVSDTPSPFNVGDRVFHQKFGNGNVSAIEGNKLTIDFDKAGQKKVLDGFVTGA